MIKNVIFNTFYNTVCSQQLYMDKQVNNDSMMQTEFNSTVKQG